MSKEKNAKLKLHFVASNVKEAQIALRQLQKKYGDAGAKNADVIVALGGDGLMLHTLHDHLKSGKPIFGMNRGSVGFLMNSYKATNLIDRVLNAEATLVHPLSVLAIDKRGKKHRAFAINEVSLLRQTFQAARLRISIDNQLRLDELVCDGILLATPAGSTAYNFSAHGPILPLDAELLALTPLNPFRPRRWRGALLPNRYAVKIDILDSQKRPVSCAADHKEIRDVVSVEIFEDQTYAIPLLFDANHSLEERVLREQFYE